MDTLQLGPSRVTSADADQLLRQHAQARVNDFVKCHERGRGAPSCATKRTQAMCTDCIAAAHVLLRHSTTRTAAKQVAAAQALLETAASLLPLAAAKLCAVKRGARCVLHSAQNKQRLTMPTPTAHSGSVYA